MKNKNRIKRFLIVMICLIIPYLFGSLFVFLTNLPRLTDIIKYPTYWALGGLNIGITWFVIKLLQIIYNYIMYG